MWSPARTIFVIGVAITRGMMLSGSRAYSVCVAGRGEGGRRGSVNGNMLAHYVRLQNTTSTKSYMYHTCTRKFNTLYLLQPIPKLEDIYLVSYSDEHNTTHVHLTHGNSPSTPGQVAQVHDCTHPFIFVQFSRVDCGRQEFVKELQTRLPLEHATNQPARITFLYNSHA